MILNWLLFFGVKSVPKFQYFAALARVLKHMWPSVGVIKKALVTLYKIVYESCRSHASVRNIAYIACQSWQAIVKFCNFKQLYLLNQVTIILAVPARKNLRVVRIFSSTKLTAWVRREKLTPLTSTCDIFF